MARPPWCPANSRCARGHGPLVGRWHVRRLATIIVSVGVGLGSLALGDANASPIRPDQRFEGLVNGGHDNVTLFMSCFGPIQPGQTGHPIGGQTLEVKTGRSFSGFTGSTGMAIVARFLD